VPREFQNRAQLFNEAVNGKIDKIYRLIQERKTVYFEPIEEGSRITTPHSKLLFLELKELQEALIVYYTEEESARSPYVQEIANQRFSEFLQHLSVYISDFVKEQQSLCVDIDNNYFIDTFNQLLEFKEAFFYSAEMVNDQVTTWIDPNTEDTALIVAAREANLAIVEKLLVLLKKQFNQDRFSETGSINPYFRDYLFHENKEGVSAWSIAQLKNKIDISVAFVNLGKEITAANPLRYREFLLEKDGQGDSSLIRAAKKGNASLLVFIIKKMSIAYNGNAMPEFRDFLQERNNEGNTALNAACQEGHAAVVEELLKVGIKAFTSNVSYTNFLMLPNFEGVSPLIHASYLGHTRIVKRLLNFALKRVYVLDGYTEFIGIINHKDNAGYSALMRAVEGKQLHVIKFFITLLIRIQLFNEGDIVLFEALKLENTAGLSVLQIAVRTENKEIVNLLLKGIHFLFSKQSSEYQRLINQPDREGYSPLARICYQEAQARSQITLEERLMSRQEEATSGNRKEIAGLLVKYGTDPSSVDIGTGESDTTTLAIPDDWEFMHGLSSPDSPSPVGFFELFCKFSNLRKRRQIASKYCRLQGVEEDYDPFLVEDKLQLRKESLVSIFAFLTQSHLDSIKEVGIIRKQTTITEREVKELARFKVAIDGFYEVHSATILNQLSNNKVLTLDQAVTTSDYALIDNGVDLAIINRDMLFSSSLLNPTKGLLFSKLAKADRSLIKNWLDSYFGSSYTLHPFKKELLNPYRPIFDAILTDTIHSDSHFSKASIEGLLRKTIQQLFLLNSRAITTTELSVDDFFRKNSASLRFRSEHLHKVFFDLSSQEQRALKKLIISYSILPEINYPSLSSEEKTYLTVYGNELVTLFDQTADVSTIKPVDFLEIAIKSHEASLQRYEFSVADCKQVSHTLKDLKTGLEKSIDSSHTKAILQLLVFLFPSTIRAIAQRNPWELSAALGLIAADVALRELLVRLANHPQTLQLFSGNLSSQLLKIVGQASDRVPIIGSLLGVYGLIQAGKALAHASPQDPNKPYYAHLLLNNLATIAIIGADVAVTLPFWPVLGLFALLTFHQIEAQGGIQKNQLHIRDDEGHPLLRLYRKVKLGLGLEDESIEMVIRQRKLFEANLNYFAKIQSHQSPYNLMAVVLPDANSIEVRIPCASVSPNRAAPIYPSPPRALACSYNELVIRGKKDYAFELGKIRDICEKRDPFYLNNANYTLLTSTFAEDSEIPWVDCSDGQRKKSYGLATSEGNAAAAIVIANDVLYNSSEQNYALFLVVDPFQVRDYSFKFNKNFGDQPQQGDANIDRLLPCTDLLSYCVAKIVVAITQLYSIKANDVSARTNIIIDNSELVNELNASVKEVQYLIKYSDNLILNSPGIHKKTFVFFNETRTLQLAADQLRTEQGFEADLQQVEVLTIQLADTYRSFGYLQAIFNQTIIINHLRGVNASQLAIFNATACNHFVVGLSENTRFIYKSLQLDIKSLNEGEVTAYGAANLLPFYYFPNSFNAISINITDNKLSFNSDDFLGKQALEIGLTTTTPSVPLREVFSGSYVLGGVTLFSRIIISKPAYSAWNSKLEINVVSVDALQLIDWLAIKRKKFNELSLFSKDLESFPSIHVVFFQNTLHPQITGVFENYRFSEVLDNTIILKHKARNEETHVVLNEAETAIVINNIRYEIDWTFLFLVAVATLDGLPMVGNDLLAPIKLTGRFNETKLNVVNNTYQFAELSIENPTQNLKVQVKEFDKPIPFAYFIYKEILEFFSKKKQFSVSHYQDARLSIVTNDKNLQQAQILDNTRWKSLLSPLSAVITALGTGLAALFINRFRSQKPAIVAASIATPLLEPNKVVATSMTIEPRELENNCSESVSADCKMQMANSISSAFIDNNDHAYQEKVEAMYRKGQLTMHTPYAGVDQQLLFFTWLGKTLQNLFFQTPKSTKRLRLNKKDHYSNKLCFFEILPTATPNKVCNIQTSTNSYLQYNKNY
jgi:ankyrin repeat protein